MLRQRKNLIGSDGWIPDIEEATAAMIVDGLISMRPAVGGGNRAGSARRRRAAPPAGLDGWDGSPARGGSAEPKGLF